MNIQEYLAEIQKQYATGVAREHSYRPALQQLLASLLPKFTVTNEPARLDCGAPDYILQRPSDNIPVAFVEAKDIGDPDLGGRNRNKEQFERYRASLNNIIFTDYLDFWLYENGEFTDSVRIAEQRGERIVQLPDHFDRFESFIRHFGNVKPQRIASPSKLAQIMAGKARLLAEVIQETFRTESDSTLKDQMAAFKEVLIHDITVKEFADVYAQTIAYGMFAARLHDPTPDTFSRHEAATLIPKTNPFLRRLFQDIAGYDLDERICWIVDDLAETFRATDLRAVMRGFGRRTQQTDPMIHFYEDFLSAYDPKLRKSRGVWYTPQAIVNFIVRAVDDILQTEFGLPMGLADTTKITFERRVDQSLDRRFTDRRKKEKVLIHKVQILDPATGTGTFLAETVSRIYERFKGQAGMWQGYVEEHLLPRLNGFELLIASYTMAHLKLDMLLSETGYKPIDNQRLRIYLTNSLEECHKDTGTLFTQFLAREANGANEIKRNTPVMVVIGNPPYSGESQNKSEWIMRLMDDYKKEPNSQRPLQERNSKWLNDDYAKFIRLGQYYVDRNTEGVLAYITNRSFIDSLTFRGMRWHLMRSFDKIYIIDLHGHNNSNNIVTAPDGSKDENVFDIMQGVSINIFVKTGHKPKDGLAEVHHFDLYGKRETKYDFLLQNTLSSIPFVKLKPSAPDYFFVPKDYAAKAKYEEGFSVTELFIANSVGMVTTRDELLIKDTPDQVEHLIEDFIALDEVELRNKYGIAKDSRDWSVARAKADIGTTMDCSKIVAVSYRPFDCKYLYYTTNGLIARPRGQVMRHFLAGDNIGLVVSRQCVSDWRYVFCTKYIADLNLTGTAGRFGAGYACPLYLPIRKRAPTATRPAPPISTRRLWVGLHKASDWSLNRRKAAIPSGLHRSTCLTISMPYCTALRTVNVTTSS